MMYGIYKYEGGLQFTGMVAHSVEEAEKYLGEKYGKVWEYPIGYDENDQLIYEKRFTPWYNKEAFKIKPLTVV